MAIFRLGNTLLSLSVLLISASNCTRGYNIIFEELPEGTEETIPQDQDLDGPDNSIPQDQDFGGPDNTISQDQAADDPENNTSQDQDIDDIEDIIDIYPEWNYTKGINDNISPDYQDAFTPKIAMNDSGNAVVTWHQNDGINTQIFISEYSGGQWSVPKDLEDNISPDGEHAIYPEAAMDNSGNAIIVWSQFDGIYSRIYKAELRNGDWIKPEDINDNISPYGGDVMYPGIAMDNNGNAVIVWCQTSGSGFNIFKSEYRNGEWSIPADINDYLNDNGNFCLYPYAAMDDNGNTIIVWRQTDGANSYIIRKEYRDGTWSDPVNITGSIGPVTQNADQPYAAMDNNNNAIIVWSQFDGTSTQIFKSEYRDGVWTGPQDLSDNISPDGTISEYPKAAMDNNGNAIIVWQQRNGISKNIYKSEYRGGAWTIPLDIEDFINPEGQSALYPEVAMDNNNNAVITWCQSDGLNTQIFKCEYRDGSWRYPSDIMDNISPDSENTEKPFVAMSDAGNTAIVWSQSNGSNKQIFKSEYK